MTEREDDFRYPSDAYAGDIVPFDMRLLGGWHELEHSERERFRWLESGADALFVNCGALQTLLIDMEPGPAVSALPVEIELLVDEQLSKVCELSGRRTVHFVLPPRRVCMSRLTIRVRTESKSLRDDPRVLDLRVFRISIARRPHDVVPMWEGCELALGWYPLEAMGREVYRWVSGESSLRITEPRSALALDIEPNPSLPEPLTIEVDIGGAGPIHRFRLSNRESVNIEIPGGVSFPTTVTLRSSVVADPAPGCGARGTFRVFRYYDDTQQHDRPPAEHFTFLAPPQFNPYEG